MVVNICPLHCRQEHHLLRQKTAAGDTSCLLMMLNVFKSTMSNFLPTLNGQLEWKPAFFSSFPVPLFFRILHVEALLRPGQTLRITSLTRNTEITETVRLRLQLFLWHEANQALISHHPVPTCCVCSPSDYSCCLSEMQVF